MRTVRFIFLSLFLFGFAVLRGQTAALQIAKDTIYMENVFEVRYYFENVEGVFSPPEFGDHFGRVHGPSQQSSVQVIGGERSSSMSYTYFLKPMEPGSWELPNAYIIDADGEEWRSETKTITVLPNPEGIQEDLSLRDMGVQNFTWGNRERRKSQEIPKRRDRKRISL